jgi:hypothetical protein
MNIDQLRGLVIKPTLKHLGLWSPAAENLVLGTALVESKAEYLQQINGPALGLWQMEPATHDDIWANFLHYRKDLAAKVAELTTPAEITGGATEMIGNLYYACAMCRLLYRRVRELLPDAKDAEGMASFYKRFYNTPLGKSSVEKALPHFIIACAGGGG